jgi:hypothetical protein
MTDQPGSGTPSERKVVVVPVIGRQAAGSDIHIVISPETVTFGVGTALFAKAYLETLGKRVAEGTANLPKYMRQLVQRRVPREDMPDETYIGMKDGTAATIVVDDRLPDEARLALLDLDVTAPELRGKELHWDWVAQAWRPWPFQPDGA